MLRGGLEMGSCLERWARGGLMLRGGLEVGSCLGVG